jgi:hypothetical protein
VTPVPDPHLATEEPEGPAERPETTPLDPGEQHSTNAADANTAAAPVSELWSETAHRFSFLLQTMAWLVLDGLFLIGTFAWFRFISTSVHHGHLDGWQATLFDYCRAVLEAAPLVLVAVHTLLDFFGAVKRMVERR